MARHKQGVVIGGDHAEVGLGEEAEGVGVFIFDGGDHALVGHIPCDIFLLGDEREIPLMAGPFQISVERENGGGDDKNNARDEKCPAGNFRGGGVEPGGGLGDWDGLQLFHIEQSANWRAGLQWHEPPCLCARKWMLVKGEIFCVWSKKPGTRISCSRWGLCRQIIWVACYGVRTT